METTLWKQTKGKEKGKKETTPTHRVELEADTVLREAKSSDSWLDYFETAGKF